MPEKQMLVREAQSCFENTCNNLLDKFNFGVRAMQVDSTYRPNSGQVWGGTDTHDWWAKVEDGEIVEQKIVGEVPTPTSWHVNGSFLRSIYRES